MERAEQRGPGSRSWVKGWILLGLFVGAFTAVMYAKVGTVRLAVTEPPTHAQPVLALPHVEEEIVPPYVASLPEVQEAIPSIQHGIDVYAFAQQVTSCWHLKGQRYEKSLITLTFAFNPDRTIQSIRVADAQQVQYKSDPAFRKIADSAIAALPSCPAYALLPLDQYEYWKTIDLSFDARAATPR